MAEQTVARRYASAVFELAKEHGALEVVAKDLDLVRDLLDNDARVRAFFVSPVVDRSEKASLFERSLSGLHPIALHTILLLIRKRRAALYGAIVREFASLRQIERGATSLLLTSARPLSLADRDSLTRRLGVIYGTTFETTAVVDRDLIGGVRLNMGDRRIDGSIAGRLDYLAQELMTVS
ncbi:MAG TPA: ATP synthase F1 subunit delta [Candidatus Baltobacteraceae bacterium]|jgi:F-type H+-transporting ATPase subunit delta|nr:ATP synthase F1 subunit delta [Candidatus Baltobacteraceae bacterium]